MAPEDFEKWHSTAESKALADLRSETPAIQGMPGLPQPGRLAESRAHFEGAHMEGRKQLRPAAREKIYHGRRGLYRTNHP